MELKAYLFGVLVDLIHLPSEPFSSEEETSDSDPCGSEDLALCSFE